MESSSQPDGLVADRPSYQSLQSGRPDKERMWQDAVEEYSSRNLTFENDGLVAFAAVAESFSPHMNCAYWGGASLSAIGMATVSSYGETAVV